MILNAQSNAAGKYTVEVGIIDGCVQKATTDSVIATVAASPCTPGNNTGDISGAITMTFNLGYGEPQGGSWFLTANGAEGDIEFEFPGTKRPAAGIYKIQPINGSWIYGDVRVRLVALSSNWPASSGKVYVTVNNNKVTTTFCNVPVSAQSFVFKTTASARITER